MAEYRDWHHLSYIQTYRIFLSITCYPKHGGAINPMVIWIPPAPRLKSNSSSRSSQIPAFHFC